MGLSLKDYANNKEIKNISKEYQDKKDVEINSLEIKYACLCELQKREEEAEKAKGEFNPTENIGETATV